MSLHGAELARLYDDGAVLLPATAADFDTIQKAAREMSEQVQNAPVNQFYLNRPLLAAEPGGLGADEG